MPLLAPVTNAVCAVVLMGGISLIEFALGIARKAQQPLGDDVQLDL
jgi:hypothetical protein